MKRYLLTELLAAALLGGIYMAGHGMDTVSAETPEKLLRHVVLFKFSDTATKEDIARVEASFAALPDKIGEIKAFEWGTNVSKEGLDQGYTHCFFLTFHSEADRDAYLVHPEHDAFAKGLGGALAGAHVLDYWAK